MKNRLIGLVVFTLLIAATVFPVAGIISINNTRPADSYNDSDTVLEQELKDSSENEEPNVPVPMPCGTKTGYLSIPPTAFVPMNSSSFFENKGFGLYGEDFFSAPVLLPHKATIKNITYYFNNEAPASFLLYLYRSHMDGNIDEMGYVFANKSGVASCWTDDIEYAEIDNSMYSYYLMTGLMEGMGCYGVVIGYTYVKDSSSVNLYGQDSIVTKIIVK